jgi:hypothetical protein
LRVLYESIKDKPLGRLQFARRLGSHFAIALSLIGGSLAIGMVGYASLEHLSWLDAFLNSAMLLGGMGPVDAPHTAAGKLFAGLYALYAGLLFIVTASVIATPILHRVIHRLHWDEEGKRDRGA